MKQQSIVITGSLSVRDKTTLFTYSTVFLIWPLPSTVSFLPFYIGYYVLAISKCLYFFITSVLFLYFIICLKIKTALLLYTCCTKLLPSHHQASSEKSSKYLTVRLDFSTFSCVLTKPHRLVLHLSHKKK